MKQQGELREPTVQVPGNGGVGEQVPSGTAETGMKSNRDEAPGLRFGPLGPLRPQCPLGPLTIDFLLRDVFEEQRLTRLARTCTLLPTPAQGQNRPEAFPLPASPIPGLPAWAPALAVAGLFPALHTSNPSGAQRFLRGPDIALGHQPAPLPAEPIQSTSIQVPMSSKLSPPKQ